MQIFITVFITGLVPAVQADTQQWDQPSYSLNDTTRRVIKGHEYINPLQYILTKSTAVVHSVDFENATKGAQIHIQKGGDSSAGNQSHIYHHYPTKIAGTTVINPEKTV